jgi:hypothetical protein
MAAIAEVDPRTGDEILDGSRDDHLTRPGLRGDTCADVDRDPSDLAVDLLAFARVEPRPDLEAEVLHRVDDRAGTADRARRPVERGEEAVADRSLRAIETRFVDDDPVLIVQRA